MEFPPTNFDIKSISTIEDRSYRCFLIDTFLYNIILFIIAQKIKDNSIVDRTWGAIFILQNAAQLTIVQNFSERSILVNVLVLIWALRLTVNNFIRHNGEDWRYTEMRQKWMKKGKSFYYASAFVFIFLQQAVYQKLINSSTLFVTMYSKEGLTRGDFIGSAIWVIGFIIEVTADLQLMVFKKNRLNKGKLLTSGLWRYSRHPNLFGEALMWWGIYIIACQVQWGWITMVSAIVATLMLRYVTGVPILEQKYADREDFKAYKKQTNCFIPWFTFKLQDEDLNSLDRSTSRVQILKDLESSRYEKDNLDIASFTKRSSSGSSNEENMKNPSQSLKKHSTVKIQGLQQKQLSTQLNSNIELQKYNTNAQYSNDKLNRFESSNQQEITTMLRIPQNNTFNGLSQKQYSNNNNVAMQVNEVYNSNQQSQSYQQNDDIMRMKAMNRGRQSQPIIDQSIDEIIV
eukprot:403335280